MSQKYRDAFWLASLGLTGREQGVIWEMAALCLSFPSSEPKLQRCWTRARQDGCLLLARLGTPLGLGKEESDQVALAKDRSQDWTLSSKAMPIPRFHGVTAAEIRDDGKGWRSLRAGGKRIKQQLAGSARGGLAQPGMDLLPPAPDPLKFGAEPQVEHP